MYRNATPPFTAGSSSSGTQITSASSSARIFSGRSYVGASTITVARRRQQLGEEAEALERAVRQDDSLGLHSMAVGDPFAERRVTAGRAVVQRGGAVALDRGARAVGELFEREALGRRNAAGERDGRP